MVPRYNPANPYIRQQIQTASPEKLILMMYELGIKSCRTKNREKAAKVLIELISALNFDYQDIAAPLFDAYKYALDQVHTNRFEEACFVLEELRDVWESSVMKPNKGEVNHA